MATCKPLPIPRDKVLPATFSHNGLCLLEQASDTRRDRGIEETKEGGIKDEFLAFSLLLKVILDPLVLLFLFLNVLDGKHRTHA